MRSRLAYMDTARGMAVAGMIAMHLVPAERLTGRAGGFVATVINSIEGKPAAAFCVLAGMAWEIQARRAGRTARFLPYVLRRAAALIWLGIALHVLVWSTEVLVPIGLMLLLTLLIRARGLRAAAWAALVLLSLAPLASRVFADSIGTDWLENGSHLTDSTVGWVTLRYLLVDGNYPLIPWMALPLVGMLLAAGMGQRRQQTRLWFAGGAGAALGGWCVAAWSGRNAEDLGDWAACLASTWVPTTIPFMLISGGTAVAVISGLAWLEETRRSVSRPGILAYLGRASLTHYIGHILLVFAPLRLAFPAEDWPLTTGLAAFVAYLALAAPFSVAWFRSHAQGPLEGVLAKLSGPRS